MYVQAMNVRTRIVLNFCYELELYLLQSRHSNYFLNNLHYFDCLRTRTFCKFNLPVFGNRRFKFTIVIVVVVTLLTRTIINMHLAKFLGHSCKVFAVKCQSRSFC